MPKAISGVAITLGSAVLARKIFNHIQVHRRVRQRLGLA